MDIQLKAGSKRGLALPVLRQAIELGYSGARTLRILREMGLGYRTQNFYADWRKLLGVKRFEQPIAQLKEDTLIPEAYTQESPWDLSDNYLYVIRAKYSNLDTGEEEDAFWGLLESERRTKEEVLSYVDIFKEDSPPEGNYEFVRATVMQAWKRSQ